MDLGLSGVRPGPTAALDFLIAAGKAKPGSRCCADETGTEARRAQSRGKKGKRLPGASC